MSDEKVVPLKPGIYDPDLVSGDTIIEPDVILENNKGRLDQLVLVGLQNGELIIAGSHQATESHALLHIAMMSMAHTMCENLGKA